ncbi:MAG TPA: rod shape-determining protein MreC [Phycisphaerae bacterium]|nr:rod shape-determining protein MreC [Phycisphaerae bacterium]
MNLKGIFSKRNALAALMLCSVVTALLGPGFASWVRGSQVFLAPLGDGGMYVVQVLRSRVEQLAQRGLSAEEARQLRAECEALRGLANHWQQEAEEQKQIATEATKFKDLYAPRADLKCVLIPARVVAVDSLPYGRMRVIAARRSEGTAPGALVTTRQIVHDCSKALHANLAVINSSSLVGRLTEETRAFTARVQLVTDPGFNIRVRIRRRVHSDPEKRRLIPRLSGDAAVVRLSEQNNRPVDGYIARGDGPGWMKIPNVSALENILPGDWVLTYPDGAYSRIEVFIGRVSEVVPNPEDRRYVTLRVRPAADLSALHQVFVLHPNTLSGRTGR